MKIYFATTNRGKFLECKNFLEEFGVKVKQVKLRLIEPQTEKIEEIAKFKAKQAHERTGRAVFVEDAGLFVKTLNGFPGVYSSYAYKTLGCRGILKLMKGARDREACFKAVIAFAWDEGKIKIFKGICKGRIALRERGFRGFGFDPIFVPQGYKKTFAEDFELKQKISHRARALEKFARYLKTFWKDFI